MSRKNSLSADYNPLSKGAPLPDPVTTDDFICVKLWCPNLPEYRQALSGQIHNLGKWYFWEKTQKGDTRAKEAAQFWRTILWEHFQMPADPCCCDSSTTIILHRVNPDTGALEISTDGGATWTPDPEDPRVSGTQLPPITAGEGVDIKCKAANGMVEAMKQQQIQHSASIDTAGDVIALAAAIAAIIITLLFTAPATAVILVPILIELAGALLLIGSDAFNALFNDTVWQDLLCIIYCRLGSDGRLTQSGLNNVLTDTDSKWTGNLALWIYDTLNALGVIGLNNAAVTYSGDLSCSSCPCAPCNLDVWDWDTVYGGGVFASATPVTRDSEAGTITQVAYQVGSFYYAALVSSDDSCCDLGLDHYEVTPATTTFAGWVDCTQGSYLIGVETNPPWTPVVIGWNCGCTKKALLIRSEHPFTVVWKTGAG